MRLNRSSRRAAALLILSAGALCFEVALLRLYAIQQFYHFAFLVISLAVLGTAGGGTALTLAPRVSSLTRLAVAFAISILAAYGTLNVALFDSYAVAWDRRQAFVLALYLATAAAPFFFAGWFTGSALAAARGSPGATYAASLVGSGAGPLLALVVTAASRLESTIAISAAAGLAAAAIVADRRRTQAALIAGAAALTWIAFRPQSAPGLVLSPNKPLAQALTYPEASLTYEHETLAARLQIVESAGVHSFPGLSLRYLPGVPDQAGLYLDGDGPLPATRLDPDTAEAADLARAMPSGISCSLRPGAQVLVLRPGAGLEAALLLGCGAASVDLPLDEPLIAEALRGPYRQFTYGLWEHPRLNRLPSSSRAALEAPGPPYDVIHVALSDPFRPVASGAFSLTETYDLTLEAFAQAVQRLRQPGLLVVDRWLTTPPAESLRAWSTVVAALRHAGLDPAPRVIAFRSLRTSTLVASTQPWSADDLSRIRSYLETNRYDPIYLPDLHPGEVNRYQRIPQDPYPDLFQNLLDDPRALERSYPYRIEPPTDDRPFFFHFFQWRQTPSAIAAIGQTWQPFGGSGYLVLLALLVLILLFAAALLLAPTLAGRSRGALPRSGWAYFAFIGAGFLLVEIGLLQRFTLPLERPTRAFVVVVAGLLVSSGVGSHLSERLPARRSLLAIGAAAVLLALGLPYLLRPVLSWDISARLVATLAVLAPLGLLMGVPFPAGLRRYASGSQAAVGVAWAVNGATSGVAGIVATMAGLDLGLGAVLGIGGLAYLGAWAALRFGGSEGERAGPNPPGPTRRGAGPGEQSGRLPG